MTKWIKQLLGIERNDRKVERVKESICIEINRYTKEMTLIRKTVVSLIIQNGGDKI